MQTNNKVTIEHDNSADTIVMAYDHQPYSSNTSGVPDDVVDAVKQGFAKNVPEFDCRQTEWN
jgi:hypothetical protein